MKAEFSSYSYFVVHSLLICSLGTIAPSHGATYTVTADTSALVGDSAGPFFLDFQFIDGSGSGDVNNILTISGFNFNGGFWSGAPTLRGGALTSIGVITLNDSEFFNELVQRFTPGSLLSFDISMTTAVDAGATPDEFSIAILDKNLSEIPTVGLRGAFIIMDIASEDPTVQSFASDLSQTPINIPAPIVTVASVPDSALPTTLIGALWVAVLGLRRSLLSNSALLRVYLNQSRPLLSPPVTDPNRCLVTPTERPGAVRFLIFGTASESQ